jgi:HSP20 family protein
MPLRDPESWMWAEACELIERAERLHRQFFQPGRPQAKRPTWEPPVDIFETEGELWVLIALPGVDPDHIQALIDGDTLVVTGERRIYITTRAIIHRLEIPYGHFERRITLPPGRLVLGRREVVNGCLLIRLRKG